MIYYLKAIIKTFKFLKFIGNDHAYEIKRSWLCDIIIVFIVLKLFKKN